MGLSVACWACVRCRGEDDGEEGRSDSLDVHALVARDLELRELELRRLLRELLLERRGALAGRANVFLGFARDFRC